MRDVVDPGLDELWTCASQEAMDRTAVLARRGVGARLAVLSSFASGRRALHSVDGQSGDLPPDMLCAQVSEKGAPIALAQTGEPTHPFSYLGVSVTIESGQSIGTLCVLGETAREWQADDVRFLEDVAATLSDRIGLASRLNVREKVGHREPSHAITAASPKASSGSSATRVLIADDLDLNRKLIADMLSIDGHEVDCVGDGADAVTAARSKEYDLILMDMIMPRMDGLAAARAIRELPSPAKDVPIVALTANCGADQLQSCLAAGMNATLTKPMTFDSLAAVISTWVRPRREAA